ncbi:hypothetical protein [Mesorhizobium sp.]|uniref:hypothetical protein n=1 Tax=Mesorhizobium sp. TaxID=1871066 RepID=UPI0025F0F042|nr:hypothetical protein [Mesorhizobium sp.]
MATSASITPASRSRFNRAEHTVAEGRKFAQLGCCKAIVALHCVEKLPINSIEVNG